MSVFFNLQGALVLMMEPQSPRQSSITHTHRALPLTPMWLASSAKRKSAFLFFPSFFFFNKLHTVCSSLKHMTRAVSKPTRIWEGAVANHDPTLICCCLLAAAPCACLTQFQKIANSQQKDCLIFKFCDPDLHYFHVHIQIQQYFI